MPENGRYTPADLVLIDPVLGWPSGYGQPRLARCHAAMLPHLRQAGYTGAPNEIYRDFARQVYYRGLYLSGNGAPAAIPGTSKHGDGLAEDWEAPMNQWGSYAQAVWQQNEAQTGYSSTQGRADGEPWHKVSVAEPSGTATAGGGATPIEEDQLALSSAAADKLAAQVQALWEWNGGGKDATEFYLIQQKLNGIKSTTDDLAAGRGKVHEKLDQILYVTNDPSSGIRARLATLAQTIADKLK